MRYIVTTTEFEFYERVYIIDAADEHEALAALHRDDTCPIISSRARRKIFDPTVEPLKNHPSYAIVKEALRSAPDKDRIFDLRSVPNISDAAQSIIKQSGKIK